jgi:HSP20 family protein
MRLYDDFNSLIPFKPSDLNRHLSNLVDSFHEGMNRYLSGFPRLNMEDNEDHIVVRVALPGVKADEIHVEVVSDFLTVKANRERAEDPESANRLYSERRFERYEEKFKLPCKVNGAMTKAAYTDGVLAITLAKDEIEKPVSVKVGKED